MSEHPLARLALPPHTVASVPLLRQRLFDEAVDVRKAAGTLGSLDHRDGRTRMPISRALTPQRPPLRTFQDRAGFPAEFWRHHSGAANGAVLDREEDPNGWERTGPANVHMAVSQALLHRIAVRLGLFLSFRAVSTSAPAPSRPSETLVVFDFDCTLSERTPCMASCVAPAATTGSATALEEAECHGPSTLALPHIHMYHLLRQEEGKVERHRLRSHGECATRRLSEPPSFVHRRCSKPTRKNFTPTYSEGRSASTRYKRF
jgi:hypothetical protein